MVEAYFTEQHELIRKLAHDFAEKELTKEVLDQVEETEEFPEEILDKMAKAGFFGVKIPRELGGQGADARAYVLVMEEIARVSASSLFLYPMGSLPPSLLGGACKSCFFQLFKINLTAGIHGELLHLQYISRHLIVRQL